MKKLVSGFLSLVLLLLLAACGGNGVGIQNDVGGNTQGGTAVGDVSASAGEEYYNVYLSADPTSMDISLNADTYSGTIINNIMEGLIRLEEKDGDYVMAPGDAQTWEQSEDGLVWTFHLGDNCWSDGQPVTAQDYVYSLQRSVDPATGCPNEWFLYPIAGYDEIRAGEAGVDALGVKALDDKTLEITLSFPMPSFLEMMSGTIFYPQRQDKIEEWGEQYGTEAEYTVSNGPYVLDSWTHNSQLVLKKSENYWNAENVSIDTVNIGVMSDTSTIMSNFESGSLDYCSTSLTEWVDKFLATDGVTYEKMPSADLAYSFYNCEDALFQNANIRKAFTLALDREDLNDMCFGGAHIPTYGWICPAISVGETNFREYAGDTVQEMIDEMTAQGLTARDYLLMGMEELGLGDDPSTLDVTFSLAGTDDWFRTFGEYLQQVYQEELGVAMKISFNDWGIFYDNVQNGNYQIGYMAWGAYYNDPYDMLSLFYSDWDSIETGWASEEYDALVDEALSELDETRRMELYKQAEDILLRQDCVVSPILTFADNVFFWDYVSGYTMLPFSITGYKGMSTGSR